MNQFPRLPAISMPVFNSTRLIPVMVDDLAPIAHDVMTHFRLQRYEVTGQPVASGGWHISIVKGTLFSALLGMKTALNIELTPAGTATHAKAGVGIFGRQVMPALIARFVAWPVWFTQIWGLVQQAKLDDEALDAVERSLYGRTMTVTPVSAEATARSKAGSTASGAGTTPPASAFCTECGTSVPRTAKFCSECGARC